MDRDPKEYMVGGSHYLTMPMQPFEFGLKNSLDPATFSVLKYVSRHMMKGGRADLDKAAHIIEIHRAHLRVNSMVRPLSRRVVHIETYCSVNKIPEAEAVILRLLHSWACGDLEETDDRSLAHIGTLIRHLADLEYGKEHK